MSAVGRLNFILCILLLVSTSMAEEKLKLAVFKVDSKLLGTEQSALLSEMLTAECSQSGLYEVVPWSEVGNALKMASDKSKLGEISSKGENIECTNSKCYDALGSLDVRYMVTARVEKPGRLLFMTLKLTDVEQMKQVKVISQKAENVDDLFESIPDYVRNLLNTSELNQVQELLPIQKNEPQKELMGKPKSKKEESTLKPWLRWGGLGLSTVGLFYTIQQNSTAKAKITAYDLATTQTEMDENWAAIQKAKRGFWTGLGVAGLGAISLGLSFTF